MSRLKVLKVVLVLVTIGLIFPVGVGLLVVKNQSRSIPDLGQPTEVASSIYDETFSAPISKVRDRLVTVRSRLTAPALSLSVGWNGELVWSEAAGYADLDSGQPVDLQSLFPIGSISKSLTAVTALRLSEKGLLDLDEDIRPAVPAFSGAAFPVTLRQLLSHQAGVRHYRKAWTPPVFSETALNVEFETVTDGLSIFVADPLLFEPDSSFNYSTFGYSLASAVMESATGREFLDLVRDEVLDPLGMQQTRADRVEERGTGRVSAYHALFSNGSVLPEPAANPSYKWAGGGYLSTTEDLVRLGNAILGGEVLADETREMMFTPRKTTDGELNEQHYGLGWRIGGMYYPSDSETIIPLISHGGTTLGAVSILILMPESGLVVAMAANSASRHGSGAITQEAAGVVRDFLDHLESTTSDSRIQASK